MVKEKERHEETKTNSSSSSSSSKKIMVGFIYNCADLKFLLSSLLLLLFLVATFLQFLPFKSPLLLLSHSPQYLRSCLQSPPPPPPPPPPQLRLHSLFQQPQHQITTSSHSPPLNLIKRAFNPIGSAAYLFIQMGAYRGGPHTFAVVGLSSKPIHLFSNPNFTCSWLPHRSPSAAAVPVANSYTILPDWGYGRVYTVVVLNCTFPSSPAAAALADGSGGRLVVTATASLQNKETFVALEEAEGAVDFGVFNSTTNPPKYDYLYCGSPLYGNLSPQRVREWLAYHVRLFGERAHFVIYDAGGVHPEVMEVVRVWVEKGVVTLEDVRDQERFDGYYHNQFLVVNDCLHKYRFVAKWMFFFDVDEFIYVEPRVGGLDRFMESMVGFTQFTIEQMPMSSKLCLDEDAGRTHRMWGMEKLVYRDVKRGIRRDRKYAIQPRKAFAVGVHLSQNFEGKTTHKTEGKIKYFHYHGTIASRLEPCREFVNATDVTYESKPYYRDETLRKLAGSVKMFELKKIGNQLMKTRQ